MEPEELVEPVDLVEPDEPADLDELVEPVDLVELDGPEVRRPVGVAPARRQVAGVPLPARGRAVARPRLHGRALPADGVTTKRPGVTARSETAWADRRHDRDRAATHAVPGLRPAPAGPVLIAGPAVTVIPGPGRAAAEPVQIAD